MKIRKKYYTFIISSARNALLQYKVDKLLTNRMAKETAPLASESPELTLLDF